VRRLVVDGERLLLEPPVIAVPVEHSRLIRESAPQESALHHHASVASRWNGRRNQRAKGEVEIGRADELFAAERHLEAASGHFQLAMGLPVHEHIAPLAVAVQIALDLKLNVVTN